MTRTPLQVFRDQFPDCEIVVLADISAGTVLAWDGALKWPQEQLDDLCELGAQALGLGGFDDLPETESAMLARATGCHVFVRSAPASSEVLCSVHAPGGDLTDSVTASRETAKHLLAGAGAP